jgi:transposase
MLGKKLDNPRRKYDAEFKADVVRMMLNGRSVRELSLSMGLNENMLHRWKSTYNEGLGSSSPQPSANAAILPPVPAAEHERVKARLREVEQERDILKKALGIFSRGI